MIRDVYQYNGPGKPIAKFDVHGMFKADFMRVIAMSPAEEEYLFALQLVHGVELKVIAFQAYHDLVWEHATTQGIDTYLHDVCCTHPGLTDLLMDRTGDLKWAKELARQKKPLPFDTDFQPFITRNLF